MGTLVIPRFIVQSIGEMQGGKQLGDGIRQATRAPKLVYGRNERVPQASPLAGSIENVLWP